MTDIFLIKETTSHELKSIAFDLETVQKTVKGLDDLGITVEIEKIRNVDNINVNISEGLFKGHKIQKGANGWKGEFFK